MLVLSHFVALHTHTHTHTHTHAHSLRAVWWSGQWMVSLWPRAVRPKPYKLLDSAFDVGNALTKPHLDLP